MRLIPIEDIIIPEYRIRREFRQEELNALGESIRNKGLLHPIVLRNDGKTLVAGERRLRAITDLAFLNAQFTHSGEQVPEGYIPITILGDLSPLDAEEAELEENTIRQDLTWQEAAKATSRLAALRARQAEVSGSPAPSKRAIALEITGKTRKELVGSYAESKISAELVVARHLDDPEVSAATSAKDALKIVLKKEKLAKHKARGEEVGRTFTSSSHRLFNEDCLTWMANAPKETFDVILTDPPYGMGADQFGFNAHSYSDDFESWRNLMGLFAEHSFRISRQLAHIYIFCDPSNFPNLAAYFEMTGWRVFRTPLIWHKPGGAPRAPWPDEGPQRCYETILFASKGKRPVNFMKPDVLSFPHEVIKHGHHAQKPVALYKELLSRSASPGDTVLDPFAGTGTIFPAAHDLKCAAIGVEIDQAYYGIALSRIEQLK